MTKLTLGMTLLALAICSSAYAGIYSAPDVGVQDKSPSYHPTKGVSYEDSYHIAGVSWNNERSIASQESDREPSSVVLPTKDEPKDPKPWLIKTESENPY